MEKWRERGRERGTYPGSNVHLQWPKTSLLEVVWKFAGAYLSLLSLGRINHLGQKIVGRPLRYTTLP